MTRAPHLVILGALVCGLAWAEPVVDHPTGNRTTPPIISSVSPLGLSRGVTTELTIEGFNLGGASGIYFSDQGIKGQIISVKELPDVPEPVRLGAGGLPATVDLGPQPPRHQVTAAVEIDPGAEVSLVRFRLHTPLGTSPESKLLVEPFYGERPDAEPNDRLEDATKAFLPAILVGAISRPGDEDYYQFSVAAGDEFVFDDPAWMLGSKLKPIVSILSPDHSVLAEFGGAYGLERSVFRYRFQSAGDYYIRISDYEHSGGKQHIYRLKVGPLPLVTSVYPLGLRRGETAEISIGGFNLGAETVSVAGNPSPDDDYTLMLRPQTPHGKSFNEIKLDLEDYPEVESGGANTSVETAQPVAAPVTINGRIAAPGTDGPKANYFRFAAKKGQKLVLEVKANRLGSELDSFLEILDPSGSAIERATVRAVAETNVTLRDHDSIGPGIRVQSWKDFGVGDYLMIGAEIARVVRLPRGPDEDVLFDSFPPIQAGTLNFEGRAQRLAFFGTSPEAHANDAAAYKVQIHPPGKQFAGNGLPLVRLPYANDDGGPGYGKDSRLEFTAPGDGEYIARLRDVQGFGGERFAYRLAIRAPRPSFRLRVEPANPNIPVGGRILVNVLAFRMDGFDGPITISVKGLPNGLHASEAVIAAGEQTTTFLLSAAAAAKLEQPFPFQVQGAAQIGGHEVLHWADPGDQLKLIALTPPSDVVMTTDTREVVLEPGGQAEITVHIRRQNGFGGRVPVEVGNLSRDIDVPALGLNGVLINEDEDSNTFLISASEKAPPSERWLYVAARVETRSPLQNSFAGEPILLRVKPKSSSSNASGAGSE